MILERFYHDGLAQASWIVGCDVTRKAIVVDPNRDVAQYLEFARANQLTIAHVTETHIHADFVSGCRELVQRTRGKLYLSGEGGPDWSYRFAKADGAAVVREGDVIRVGRVRLDVMHTPGHTPEHLSFVVTDEAASPHAIGIFTGDFVFVGDVGRPDLLERAANVAATMEPSARALFASLGRFRQLPDYLQVWPGHGAGSACGKSLGALPQSTIGYERVANWGVAEQDEETFVRSVLEGQPDPPRYFAEMKRVNRDGPALFGEGAAPKSLGAAALSGVLDDGVLVDIRQADTYAGRHVPGSLNIPLNRKLTTWAGWFLSYGRDIHLVADTLDDAATAARELGLIGLDRVAGVFLPEAVGAWRAMGNPLEELPRIDARELARRIDGNGLVLLDVRDPDEWSEGHVKGARLIPVAHLPEHVDELPHDAPTVVYCQTGSRSAIGASLLQSRGFSNVLEFRGGFEEWTRLGLPSTTE